MSRKNKHAQHANHERWLVSYADFITLLFAFFVVLYSSSQVDKAKMGKLAAAIEGAFQELGVFQGSTVGPPIQAVEAANAGAGNNPVARETRSEQDFQKIARIAALTDTKQAPFTSHAVQSLKVELERALAAEISRREVALRVGPEGLIVSLREVGFFDSGSAVLKPGSEAAVGRVAGLLRERGVAVRVEGHTDNVPIHTAQFTSNWELSTARATQMISFLISRHQLSPTRLSAAGYGEFHPVATNATADGRRQNRRVDLVILAAQGPNLSSSAPAPDSRNQTLFPAPNTGN
ncbi:MAG TPA: flagellar motor protein MotB [Terriglobales bacterium]|nr:flagellar motor protein MotB [Terriglobales bacterium]